MGKFSTVMTLIILLTLFVVCATDSYYMLKIPALNDLIFNGYTLEIIVNARTLSTCAIWCIMNKKCVSIFYNKTSTSCVLKSVLFMSPPDGVVQSGTRYYSVYEEGCPSDFIRNRHHDLCYKPVVKIVLHISHAVGNCSLGGNVLLRATTVAAYNHVSDQMLVTPGNVKGYYIGGSDEVTEGHWIFENGEDMTAFIWGYDEPDNYTDSDFIYIKNSNGRYVMSDTNSELYGAYICQRLMTA